MSRPLSLTLGGALALGAHQVNNTLVDLDSGNDVLLLQQLNEGGAIVGLLVEGLVEQNDSRDVLRQLVVGGEQQLAVLATVVVGVLGTDISQALSHGADGLISGQNSLAGGDDSLSDALKLSLQLRRRVVEVGSHSELRGLQWRGEYIRLADAKPNGCL